LINPDYGSAWNTRKELVEKGSQSALKELKFSELVLSRKPKSPDNFVHRHWLLNQLATTASDAELNELINNELRVSLDTASKYQRNYYAWSHRIWVMDDLCKRKIDMLNFDLNITEHWIQTHISDYSGFQYRQYLLSCVQEHYDDQESGNPEVLELLEREMRFLNSNCDLYPDRESLFMHRRFLLSKMSTLNARKVRALQETEITFIENHLSHAYGNSMSNNWQFELISRHVKWINKVLKWDLDPEKLAP